MSVAGRGAANLRCFVEARSGALLGHNGGAEDGMDLLPEFVGQADLMVFLIECVSHEATGMVKRACKTGGTDFRPVRSASLLNFVQAVMPAQTGSNSRA